MTAGSGWAEYPEEDYLQLSGLQHFMFCRRQWALIHIECSWKENLLTTQGQIFHERVHDSSVREKRGGVWTVRGLKVSSRGLGVSGTCDAVEFHPSPAGVPLRGRPGTYLPYPVEYKSGKPAPSGTQNNQAQLCAQAMCLEEMMVCDVPEGAVYYGAPRRRETVQFTKELRETVQVACQEMHELFRRQYTPKVQTGTHCRSCSMADLCLPKLCKPGGTALEYLRKRLEEDP